MIYIISIDRDMYINHDRLHRICTFQPFGCGQKTQLRIFGVEFWSAQNRAKANTIGITMFPYRKRV